MFKKSLFVFLFCWSSCLSAGQLALEWEHYFSDPILKEQSNDYVFAKWNQRQDFYWWPFYFDSHWEVEYALDSSRLFYINVPELYVFYEYSLKKPVYSIEYIALNLGRKIKLWSWADEYWDMGLWNSLSKRNALHPVTNGLLGSFLYVKANTWSMDFFLGAIHLPNQGVSLVEEDGNLYSPSRWFSPLPNQVESWDLDIKYSLNNPYIFDVLFQQSYLLSFKIWSQKTDTYYWMKWSIADKPVNHLFFVLNKSKLLEIRDNREAVVDQKITVLPVRQRIFLAEWGVDYKKFSAAFTMENTKMKEVGIQPEEWYFLDHREDFTYFSSLLRYQFSPKSFVQAAYIQSWIKDYDTHIIDFQADKIPSILRGYKILEGIGLDWQVQLPSFKTHPSGSFSISYRHSLLSQGDWLFIKTFYYLTPKIYASLAVDILGAQKSKNYFFNQFKHNDYLVWGLGYDF